MNPKENLLVDGVMLVDKPQTWTSHDVCDFIKKRFRIKKVGHAGTLDPLATGLLVILLGRGTKLSNPLMSAGKEYEGVMELGVETDSHDRQGKVLREEDASGISLEQIEARLGTFTGEIVQVPPMVSALKHKGKRLYQLARQGKEVEREGRTVMVHAFEILSKEGVMVRFRTHVSKGTYVRTLVHDLGHALGNCATLAGLRRTCSGEFLVKDAVTIDALRETTPEALRERVLPMSRFQSYACRS